MIAPYPSGSAHQPVALGFPKPCTCQSAAKALQNGLGKPKKGKAAKKKDKNEKPGECGAADVSKEAPKS